MTIPYEPSKTLKEYLQRESLKRKQGCKEPLIGGGVGGVCIPIVN
jgi:hypothetical protein